MSQIDKWQAAKANCDILKILLYTVHTCRLPCSCLRIIFRTMIRCSRIRKLEERRLECLIIYIWCSHLITGTAPFSVDLVSHQMLVITLIKRAGCVFQFVSRPFFSEYFPNVYSFASQNGHDHICIFFYNTVYHFIVKYKIN